MFDDVLRNADRLTTYRQICAQVARENGIFACFMTKPFMGVSASGCHHNMGLWRGGEDVFVRTGNDPDNLPGMRDGSVSVVDLKAQKVVASMDTLKNAGFNPNSIVLLPKGNDLAAH